MLKDSLLQWIQTNSGLLIWIGFASGLLFLGSLFFVPWMSTKIPEDYLVSEKKRPLPRPWILWPLRIVKNILGLLLLALGLIMLVAPGQGLLTIMVGLGLINFPGRRRLVRRILGHPRIFVAVNWMRTRRSVAPLIPPWKAG